MSSGVSVAGASVRAARVSVMPNRYASRTITVTFCGGGDGSLE